MNKAYSFRFELDGTWQTLNFLPSRLKRLEIKSVSHASVVYVKLSNSPHGYFEIAKQDAWDSGWNIDTWGDVNVEVQGTSSTWIDGIYWT